MDGDGGLPAKRAKLSLAAFPGAAVPVRRRHRLSDLPDEILVSILLQLDLLESAAAAARASVLSRRWRGLWAQVPVLTIECGSPDAAPVRAALAANAAPYIQSLTVYSSVDTAPDATASWLHLAAPRLSGELYYHNRSDVSENELNNELHEEVMVERGAFELPCLKKATKIMLRLGFLGLALPPTGVFDALRVLRLENFQFQGQFSLGDTMCPSLQQLYFRNTRGLVDLELSSKSLLFVYLLEIRWLQRLSVVTRGLKVLNVVYCLYDMHGLIANIAAEMLEELRWTAPYDPSSVSLSEMRRLLLLHPPPLAPYRLQLPEIELDQDCMRFLKHFPAVDHLTLDLLILPDEDGLLLPREDITNLPDIKMLSLLIRRTGHVFGASVLPLLMLCTGIRELNLKFIGRMEVQKTCPPNCICDQPPSWRAQDILMKDLEEVEILNFAGAEHEVDFVKLLFNSAPALKTMEITCSSRAGPEKVFEALQSISRFLRQQKGEIRTTRHNAHQS